MFEYKFTKDALAFLQKIPKKHAKQIVERIEKLARNPDSVPSKQLEGYPQLKRAKSSRYRFIFRIDDSTLTLLVLRIGKRNDSEVYKRLEVLKP